MRKMSELTSDIISESIRTKLHLTLPQLHFKLVGFDPLVMSIFCFNESRSDFLDKWIILN